MTILVTGGNGVMGQALREFLPDATYLSRQECDVRNDRQLNEVFQKYQPSTVIHAAALTDHQHPDAGQIIETNVIGTERVARYCRAFAAKLVYLSTHYVYPGETGNYKETDETRPIGTYAWSKLAGEGWARLPDEWLIVRGSWYTDGKLAVWYNTGALVDAYCSRTTTRDAARAIASLTLNGAQGIYNIGGRRRTFHDIAQSHFVYDVPAARREWLQKFVSYPFPADSSVSTEKYDSLVGSIEGALSASAMTSRNPINLDSQPFRWRNLMPDRDLTDAELELCTFMDGLFEKPPHMADDILAACRRIMELSGKVR